MKCTSNIQSKKHQGVVYNRPFLSQTETSGTPRGDLKSTKVLIEDAERPSKRWDTGAHGPGFK